jgi:hypothetical protein
VVVRSTLPSGNADGAGLGIVIQHDPTSKQRAVALIDHSLVIDNRMGGIGVTGSDATISTTIVRNTLPQKRDGAFGKGIEVHGLPGLPATLVLSKSRIAGTRYSALQSVNAIATIEHCDIEGAAEEEKSNQFGDGVGVSGGEVTIRSASIHGAARAGVASFGGKVTLLGSELRCNGIALDVETGAEGVGKTSDGGGNRCGCASDEACHALSSTLAPPEPLPLQ